MFNSVIHLTVGS